MMLPAVLWLVYAVPAYVLWTAAFRIRYGFSPVVGHFPPRNLYSWIDAGLALTVLAYSVWIMVAPPTDPAGSIGVPLGIGFWACGFALRWWAMAALGPHWRIGQDAGDQKARFVATGPYHFIHHPINAALVLVAIGQALMTDLDTRALLLLVVSVLYFLIQGRAEERRWSGEKCKAQSAKCKPESKP